MVTVSPSARTATTLITTITRVDGIGVEEAAHEEAAEARDLAGVLDRPEDWSSDPVTSPSG